MTSRRPLIPAAVAAAAALAPAASAQAPPADARLRPAVLHGRAAARLHRLGLHARAAPSSSLFSVPGERSGRFTSAADAAGGIAGRLGVEEDALLAEDEDRRDLGVTANDRRAPTPGAAAGVPVRHRQFTFTRWTGFSPGRYVPGRKVEVEAYGWAFAAGKPLYFLFQKGRTTVASVRAGA